MDLNYLKYLGLSICALVSWNAYSQPSSVEHPYLKNISTDAGLSQNTVNAFFEDSTGFIWIATDSGINRYDGSEMVPAKTIHTSLLGQSVNSIDKDNRNNLWLSTQQGLTKITSDLAYDNISGFPLITAQSHAAITVLGSELFNQQQRLVFTSHGIYLYTDTSRDLNQAASMKIFHSSNNHILSYAKDQENYWLGSSKGLYFYNTTSNQVTAFSSATLPKMPIDKLTFISVNKQNQQLSKQLLVGGKLGLFILTLSSSTEATVKQLLTENVSAITQNKNTIYISVKNTLHQMSKSTGQLLKLFSLTEELPDHSNYIVESILIDSRGLLWIGTKSQGVYLWDSRTRLLSTWDINKNLSQQPSASNQIWSILPDTKQGYWLGTDAGLDYVDLSSIPIASAVKKSTDKIKALKLKVFDVKKIASTLWLGSSNGLLEYNIKTTQLTNHFNPFVKQSLPFVVYSLVASDDKTLWLATNIGVIKFNINSKGFSYENHIMARNNATPVRYIDFKKQKLWIALTDKLITYEIADRKTQVIFNFKRKANGKNDTLTDLLILDDELWLSFNGDGIYAINRVNNKEKHFHTTTGFPDNFVFSLLYNQQYIWAATTQGLIAINQKSRDYRLFTHKDGLVNNEFNEGAAQVTKQEKLLLGGSKGLSLISPKQLINPQKTTSPIVSMVRTYSKNKIVAHLNTNILNNYLINDSDTLEFHLTTLDYINAHEISYQYRLNGQAETKFKENISSTIIMTNLPIGTHHLELRYQRMGSNNFSAIKSIEIKVVSSQWFTVPKSIGNYLLLSLIFILIAYFRYKAHKKSKKLYDKIASNEKRLELALLDEYRGIWDCLINHQDFESSIFIIYQHSHEPIKLTLKQYFKLIHPDDAEKAISVWKDFAQGRQVSYFETYRNYFNQHWVWNRIYGKINDYYKNGKPKRATGIWSDITQEKRTEDQLNLFSHAFQSTQDIVIILGNDFVVKVVNNAYEKTTGFLASNMIGKSMVELAATRFTKKQTDKIQAFVNENKQWQGESSVARKNSPSFPVDIKVNIISQNDRDLGYVLVMRDISDIKQSKTLPIKSSFYDQVTGLPNKAIAFDRLRQLIKKCDNDNLELSVVFLNIEQFSMLIEKFNRDTINTLLIKLCERLIPYIGRHDVFAKYDSDTFIIILLNKKDDNSGLFTVNQLLREGAKPFTIDSNKINISCCAGISRYPDDSGSWSELITKAETVLAQTKKQGSYDFKYYHADSNKEATERVALENKLMNALKQEELFLVYQPLVKLDNMKHIEYDINIRWKLDNEQTIYPSQFMPIAEKLGLVDSFNLWIIDNALKTLRHWNEEGFKIYINLNLHVKYLLNPEFIEIIKQQLDTHSIDSQCVFIAIHEDDIMQNIEKLTQMSVLLGEIGVRLVLDDFGKSSASIQNIKKLKFHSVKFDRTLIRKIKTGYFNDRVLQGIISLLNDLNIGSVAKGIETTEQLNFLQQYKCRYGQGFLLSDPLNENQARLYLLDNK